MPGIRRQVTFRVSALLVQECINCGSFVAASISCLPEPNHHKGGQPNHDTTVETKNESEPTWEYSTTTYNNNAKEMPNPKSSSVSPRPIRTHLGIHYDNNASEPEIQHKLNT